MKKTYIKPEMTVVAVSTGHLLASSGPSYTGVTGAPAFDDSNSDDDAAELIFDMLLFH